MFTEPARKLEKKKNAKLEEYASIERKQKELAYKSGLEKYFQMDTDEAKEYQEGVDALLKLSSLTVNSVYQEKEHDWATIGGIAQGIAGPAAGMAAALDAMQDNERIRAENAERRDWAKNQGLHYTQLAIEKSMLKPRAHSMEELKNHYAVLMSWSPKTLFTFLKFHNICAAVDHECGSVTVSANWQQVNKSLYIDGALRAKLYHDNNCVGCAYLVFPKNGTSGFKGKLSGICSVPKEKSTAYSVKIEPINLWELAEKSNIKSHSNENLSDDEHDKIVQEYENQYYKELHR